MSETVRAMLAQNIKEFLKGEQSAGLLFSGGTDSTCVLFSLLEVGIYPTLYTYYLEGNESEDLNRSRLVSEQYGTNLVEVEVRRDFFLNDIHELYQMGIRGKVPTQCMHGHLYIGPQVKENLLFDGNGSDDLHGSIKTMAIWGRDDKEVLDKARIKELQDPVYTFERNFYKGFGCELVSPFMGQNVIDFLMTKTWNEMNRPKGKWITVKDYPEILEMKGYFRERGSQQIVSGIREFHSEILHLAHNKYGTSGYPQLYEDIGRGKITKLGIYERTGVESPGLGLFDGN